MQNTLKMGSRYRGSIALLVIVLACVFGGFTCWGQEKTSTESSSRTTMKMTGDTTVIDSKSSS